MAQHQSIQEGRLNNCPPKAEDVACDFCTGRKRRATKSCLHCLVSYCEEHLQPHDQVTQFKRHKLIEASTKLQENVCTHHGEGRMIFCRTDQQCICYRCSLDEHKGHETVSAAAEMTKRKKDIGPRRQTIKQIIQDKEKTVAALQQEVKAINHSAEKAVTDSQKLSTDLIHLIEKGSSDLTDKIRSQQQTEVSRAKRIQEKLKQELTELRRTDAELEKLSQTEVQTHFLHKYISLPPLSKSTALPNMNKHPLRYFEDVTEAVSEVLDTTKEIYDKKWKKIPKTVADVDVLLPQNPKTRAECSRFAVQRNYLKLDPDTANMMMALSEDNRKATSVRHQQPYSNHSARFMTRSQVLSVKSLTGRCYWEVKWAGLGVAVAVAFKDISREGEESIFGNNNKSWVLECVSGNYTFRHDGNSEKLKRNDFPTAGSSRVGVFLDSKAGTLSFYEVSDTITRLHTVQTTFTQRLYAGLGVYYYGSTAEFCDIN